LRSPGAGTAATPETLMPTAPYAFWLVALAAAVIGALLRRLAQRQGKRLLGIAGGLWLAYALWEVAVQVWSPEANIRVELLLWYPALLICTLVGLLRNASPPR